MHTFSIGRAGRPKGAERGNTSNYGLGLKQGRGGGGSPADFPLIYRHGPRLSTQHTAPKPPRMKCVKHSKDKSDKPRSVGGSGQLLFLPMFSLRIWMPIIDSLPSILPQIDGPRGREEADVRPGLLLPAELDRRPAQLQQLAPARALHELAVPLAHLAAGHLHRQREGLLPPHDDRPQQVRARPDF